MVAATHVRVRIPAPGLVASEVLEEHPDARLACVEAGRRHTALGTVVDLLALAEGLDDTAMGDLTRRWQRRYGLPAVTLGTAFALRLPLPLGRVTTPGLAALHNLRLEAAKPVGHILKDGVWDLWMLCLDPPQAGAIAASVRARLPPEVPATVGIGEPDAADEECWAALRLADEANPPTRPSSLQASRPGHPI